MTQIKNVTENKHGLKVAIIGGGSWATALFNTISGNTDEIRWWLRKPETVQYILANHRNPNYLRSVELHFKPGYVSNNLIQVIRKSDIIIIAIPSLFVRRTLTNIAPKEFKGKIVVSAVKGIIPHNHTLVSDYFRTHFSIPDELFVFLTGPSHAEEVAEQRQTYITLGSSCDHCAEVVSSFLQNKNLKIRISHDVKALEYAAALKNIYAIAVGMATTLGYGDNFQAVLISNAIREMNHFLEKMVPGPRDLLSSAYLGDLMVTSISQFSRNRTFGGMLGKGYSTKSALIEMQMIPEGYFAVRGFHRILHKTKIKMPIADTIYRILYQKAPAQNEYKKLEKYLV